MLDTMTSSWAPLMLKPLNRICIYLNMGNELNMLKFIKITNKIHERPKIHTYHVGDPPTSLGRTHPEDGMALCKQGKWEGLFP